MPRKYMIVPCSLIYYLSVLRNSTFIIFRHAAIPSEVTAEKATKIARVYFFSNDLLRTVTFSYSAIFFSNGLALALNPLSTGCLRGGPKSC